MFCEITIHIGPEWAVLVKGTTGVMAIGIVGMIFDGLFGSRKHK